jgi:hypothetical protein
MKTLFLLPFILLSISCNNTEEVIVENIEKPTQQLNKSYSHEFADNEIVYLKPDSIPCFVSYKDGSHSYALVSLDKNSLFQESNRNGIDTTLIFPKRLK